MLNINENEWSKIRPMSNGNRKHERHEKTLLKKRIVTHHKPLEAGKNLLLA
jgi:hypothetical protein